MPTVQPHTHTHVGQVRRVDMYNNNVHSKHKNIPNMKDERSALCQTHSSTVDIKCLISSGEQQQEEEYSNKMRSTATR